MSFSIQHCVAQQRNNKPNRLSVAKCELTIRALTIRAWRGLEHQLVVDLKDHKAIQIPFLDVSLGVHHHPRDDVGSGALDWRLNRHVLCVAAVAEIGRLEVGQVAIKTVAGEEVHGSIEEETEQVMKNIERSVQEAGFEMSDIVRAAVFLTDINDYAALNGVYSSYFPETPPARASAAVKELELEFWFEISCIAKRNNNLAIVMNSLVFS